MCRMNTCYCCYSTTWSCPALHDPMDCSTPGFPVLHYLRSLSKFKPIESVMPSNHPILCHPLFLLPSIFPSIRVLSNESALCIRWPKFWSFTFSISPSNEHPGLNSFRIDWLDLLAVQDSQESSGEGKYFKSDEQILLIGSLITLSRNVKSSGP